MLDYTTSKIRVNKYLLMQTLNINICFMNRNIIKIFIQQVKYEELKMSKNNTSKYFTLCNRQIKGSKVSENENKVFSKIYTQ